MTDKEYVLALINAERARSGKQAVVMGDNIAVQLHAESSLRNCFASHWGTDGLTPYERYNLAGGYQSSTEVFWGVSYCIKDGEGHDEIGEDATEAIYTAYRRLLETGIYASITHLRTLKKVNIGLARDKYNLVLYQHFEDDYVEFDSLPKIENGILSFSGKTRNGAHFAEDRDLELTLSYNPPPRKLTSGQLARTGCGGTHLQLGMVLPRPLVDENFRLVTEERRSVYTCPNPHDVQRETPPPSSFDEAYALWREFHPTLDDQTWDEKEISYSYIVASEWTAKGDTFSVVTDISNILAEQGNGVYGVNLSGKVGFQTAAIAKYTIFYGITPPDTYTPH